jgi:hypothetical protein
MNKSNDFTNDDKEDSRFSFVSVNSQMVMSDNNHSTIKQSHFKQDDQNIINLTNNLQNNQNKFNNESQINMSMSVEKFEEMPLQMNIKENGKKYQDKDNFKEMDLPCLIILDKGEKKDYIGTYKNYEISEINEKREKRILCYRRYDNFDIFYHKLKRKYPYHLIPKLIGKNALTKIITIDTEFYNKRRRQLNYFLNYLFKHNKIKEYREFTKFINDPEFDEEYFKKEDNPYNFPEATKYNESIKNKIFGVFSNFTNYFKPTEEEIEPTEEEKKIKKREMFYKKLLTNLKEIKNNLVRKFFYFLLYR